MKVRNETWSSVIAALMIALPVGCGSNNSTDGGTDSGPSIDSGTPDSGEVDAGTTSDFGAACTSDPVCSGGTSPLCLTETDYGLPDGYCTGLCTTDSDCGAGGTCQPFIGLQDGGSQSVCLETCTTSCSRTSYVCTPLTGATPAVSACLPTCVVNNECAAGTLCDATSGLCAPPPTPTSSAGTLTSITKALVNPISLSQQGAKLFVSETDSTAGSIDSVAETAASTPTVVEASITNSGSVVTDATNVYWVNQGTFGTSTYNNDGAILQAALAGGKITTLASALTSPPDAIAVSGTTVFFAVQGTNQFGLGSSGAAPSNGMILSVQVGGGTVTTLVSSQATPGSLAADATNIYWTNLGTLLESSAGFKYNDDGSVMQATLAGASPITIAKTQLAPGGVAVDSSNIYWTNGGALGVNLSTYTIDYGPSTGSVLQAAIGGGTATTLAMAQDVPGPVAVGSGAVYWINGGSTGVGSLNLVPVGGGTAQTLASQLTQPTSIVLNGMNVFFADYGTGNMDGAILEFTPQ